MKVWRKFSVVALALVIVLAFGAVASASSASFSSANRGVFGAFDAKATPDPETPTAAGDTITLVKELKMYNPSETEVNIYPPTISYTYTIGAGDPGKSITDLNGVAVKTKAGPVTTGESPKPSISTTATWTTGSTVSASSSGVADRKSITVDFTGVTFSAAGVYRYVITETNTEADYTSAGVTDGGGNIRYLDVYVMDDATNPSDKVIYGYVLSTDNDTTAENIDSTKKTEGFIGDTYHTYNLSVTKQVVNDNYNKTTHHAFPFTVTFTNATNAGTFRIASNATGTSTSLTAPSASVLTSGFATSPNIADGGVVTYYGIPLNTAVAIVEQNNVVGATYAVSSTGGTAQIDQTITENGSTNSVTVLSAHTSEDLVSIVVTNTLQLISPTGVTLRYAPYLAMLGAGVVALPLSIRRKREDF